MSVIHVTPRPSHYAKYDTQERISIQAHGVYSDAEQDTREREESIAWSRENAGRLTVRMEVGGIKDRSSRYKQKRILEVMNRSLHKKGTFVRHYCNGDDYGFYQWERFILHGNIVTTAPFSLEDMEPVFKVLQGLDEAGWYPDPEIEVQLTTVGGDFASLINLINILESRQPLIEEALSLRKPLQIALHQGVALGIALSAFSYTAVEAAAFLLEQSWRMALTTGRARMKPCDMSNPKYQMRSWLLRLGFIGERFERPRKTLLEGLAGDIAFYEEEQKKIAAAKRKARKLSGVLM